MATVFRPAVVGRQEPVDGSRALRSQAEQFYNAALLGLAVLLPVGQQALAMPPGGAAPIPFVAQAPNLLCAGALTGNGAKPFSQADWPVPRGAEFPRLTLPTANARPIALLSRPPRLNRIEQPVPRGAVFPPELRGFLNAPTPSFLLTGAQPFAQYAWPLAAGPARVPTHLDGSLSSPSTLISAVVPAPFVQTDWPLARGAAPLAVSRVDLSASIALLSAVAPAPFAQTDWPNPIAAAARALFDAGPVPLALRGVAPSPFFQSAWPNPLPTAALVGRADQAAALTLLPAFGGAQPITPAPIENPQRGAPPAAAWIAPPTLLVSTLAPAVPAPFAKRDWPLPTVAVRPTSTDALGAPLALFSGAPAPFYQVDWPLAPARAPAQQQAPGGRPIALLAPVFAPFAQADWPLSIRPAPAAQQGETRRGSLALLTAPTPKPFAQADWPLPPTAAPRGAVTLYVVAPAVLPWRAPVGPSFVVGNWRFWNLPPLRRAVATDARTRAWALGAVQPPALRGRAWHLSEEPMTTLVKRSSESVLFDVDFSPMLAAGETITAVSSIAAAPTTTTPLAFSAGAISTGAIVYPDHTAPAGTVVQVTISGGSIPAGASITEYIVRVKVATTINAVVEGTVRLQLNDTPIA